MRFNNISIVILTYNEELHIKRCLNNISKLTSDIYIIDCFSTDKTVDIAKSFNAKVIQHSWPGNQAEQFNWALDNINIETEWILRIDADEYLLPELIEELKLKLENIEDNISGIVFKRRHIFMDKWMKKGIYPVKILRMFRTGKARSEVRLMDEHIVVSDGEIIEMNNDFCDHNLNPLSFFCNKHVNYAKREAAEMLSLEFGLKKYSDSLDKLDIQASEKRNKKSTYAKSPLFLRSFLYFFYRYIARGAFLEGMEGFVWSFMQGWWYRTLVDAIIF